MTETLHLRVLGGAVALVFTHPECADAARRLFGPMLHEPWSTPDVVIECSWPRLTRSFIRTRVNEDAADLAGIRVYSSEHPNGMRWTSPDPPFLPVELEPFRHRFVRLHAAAAITPSGNVLLIVGESGSGKTTLSSRLAEKHGYRLLTDEDAFLYRRSLVVEPFATGDGPWLDPQAHAVARSLHGRRPDLIANNAGPVGALVVLDTSDSSTPELTSISDRHAFNALMASQRPGGSTATEGVTTLAALARATEAYVLAGGAYEPLIRLSDSVARLLR